MVKRYEALVEDIRARVRSGALRPGDKIQSIRHLAEEHGVAYMTARRAHQQLVEAGVLESRGSAGSFVCDTRSARLQVALVVHRSTELPSLSHPLIGRMCEGYIRAADALGCSHAICTYNWSTDPKDLNDIVRDVLRRGLDGVLFNGARTDLTRLPEMLNRHMPVVAVEPDIPHADVDLVTQDEYAHALAMVDHLIQRGMRRLVYQTTAKWAARPRGQERERAVLMAARDRGCEVQVVCAGHEETSGPAAAEVISAMPTLPDAVLSFSDGMAMLLVEALARIDISVPHDLLVAGHDNWDMNATGSRFLTTTDPEFETMGRRALEVLTDRIRDRGGRVPVREYVPGRLRIRRSTSRRADGPHADIEPQDPKASLFGAEGG